jgi:hypothetical protein
MNDLDTPDPLDAALRAHAQQGTTPDDAGFTLRVMAALPPFVSPAQRRRTRWLRRARWVALSAAGCGAAWLLTGPDSLQGGPHLAAGLALVGLLIFWTLPLRWNRP